MAAIDDPPDPALYTGQTLADGFAYITTRDGTTLSANVVLPGPAEEGPYPTVVEYSGYGPSNPDASGLQDIFGPLGYAWVGVNMRGTGCSGGSFQFFEPVQLTDGYDVIETVAAQDWVKHNEVGMVGISYPGISQLFVAAAQPPSLAAITPLSVLDDAARSTLSPGGILNTGFAVAWSDERERDSEPYGQGWEQVLVDAGDTICEANQALRLQNTDARALIEDTTFYVPELVDEISPVVLADRIEVPVFLAGAWQDEQTGGHFPELLDDLTNVPELYATMVNGAHTESVSPAIMVRYLEFLELYVDRETPDLTAAALIGPVLTPGLYGVSVAVPDLDRLAGLPYDEALATFEADPRIRILFEQGAADGTEPRTPLPRFEAGFDAWPIPPKVRLGSEAMALRRTIRSLDLVTVCEDAGCPNLSECWSDGTATFMVLGDRCTRACGFCLVDTRHPVAPVADEPSRVAAAIERMGLDHAVLTMVARDDLPDGGMAHVAACVAAIRTLRPATRIETLISDAKGDEAALDLLFVSRPDVLNHNIETVARLQRAVRPSAGYARSLSVLARAGAAGLTIKTGFMVGLGETDDEVVGCLADLADVGVDIVTIGQYLRPTSTHLPIARYAEPAEFERWKAIGEGFGIGHVEAGPLTRSSYHAKAAAAAVDPAEPAEPAERAEPAEPVPVAVTR